MPPKPREAGPGQLLQEDYRAVRREAQRTFIRRAVELSDVNAVALPLPSEPPRSGRFI